MEQGGGQSSGEGALVVYLWVFSTQYPKGLENTLQFLEHALLGRRGEVRTKVAQWPAKAKEHLIVKDSRETNCQ